MGINEMFVSDKDTETHRVCGTCGELKPTEDFYKDGKDNHGNAQRSHRILLDHEMGALGHFASLASP